MDVLLVAAKKEKIADYTGVIGQAGRVAVVIDVDAFALQNAYEVNYGTEADAVVVLLNAGASATNINILHGDQSVFTRDISIGGNAYTEALQKELNLPFEQADELKRGAARRRRDLRRRAAGAARGDRERDARGAEDVRLLQGTSAGLRQHHAHRRQRRRVARRGLHRDAGRALPGAGRVLRSVQARGVRRREVRRRRRRGRRRRRRSRSASRCAGRATDDSHQPPRRRTRNGQEGARRSSRRRIASRSARA